MTTATGTRSSQKIDTLMERASKALVETRYFECERLAMDALRLAHGARDYARMARILLPLQEARRQKRLLAVDAGEIRVLDARPAPEEPAQEPIAGCWLIAPPLVGADGRALRERADDLEIPVVVIVREPETRDGRWPLVMIGPATVRTKVEPADELTMEWFLEAGEALGDAAIEQVEATSPAAVRVDRLFDRLQTLPDHEKLHQALEAACQEAQRQAAADAAAGGVKRRKPRKPAPDEE